MPEELIRVWQARGIEIVQGYGLTEAAPNVLCLPPEDAMRKMGSAGKPYPFVDVRLGAEAELQVRGPNVFPGYWRNPEATAAVLRDGWLHTGDVAEVDDEGCYRIRGRLKDMYISGGENVYPAEVESVLHEHPAVARRRRRRRAGRALGRGRRRVRRRRGSRSTEDALVEHCRDRLARYKVPKRVRLRRGAADVRDEQGAEGRAARARRARGGDGVTDLAAPLPTDVDGKELTSRGAATRERLLEAAETVFAELGYHEASIVKITEAAGVAQGTFYLYFASKQEIFEELVRDLNRRVRHAMARGAERGRTRVEAELLGFSATSSSRRSTARSTGSSARRSSSRRRRCTSTTTRSRPGTSPRSSPRWTRGEVAADGSAGARVGADGHGRAARHALDRVGGRARGAARAADGRCRS